MNHPLLAAIRLAAPLEAAPKFTLYAVWHMATLSLLASVAGWIYCLYRPAGTVLGIFLGALWCGFGLIFLAIIATFPEYALFRQLSQWLLLLPCGLLAVWGLRRPTREKTA